MCSDFLDISQRLTLLDRRRTGFSRVANSVSSFHSFQKRCSRECTQPWPWLVHYLLYVATCRAQNQSGRLPIQLGKQSRGKKTRGVTLLTDYNRAASGIAVDEANVTRPISYNALLSVQTIDKFSHSFSIFQHYARTRHRTSFLSFFFFLRRNYCQKG